MEQQKTFFIPHAIILWMSNLRLVNSSSVLLDVLDVRKTKQFCVLANLSSVLSDELDVRWTKQFCGLAKPSSVLLDVLGVRKKHFCVRLKNLQRILTKPPLMIVSLSKSISCCSDKTNWFSKTNSHSKNIAIAFTSIKFELPSVLMFCPQ